MVNPEGAPTTCETPRDTCTNLDGKDPIFNVMKYVSNECRVGFTKDQTKLMRDAWNLYRKPGLEGKLPVSGTRTMPHSAGCEDDCVAV